MAAVRHLSVVVDPARCDGRMACMRVCPTEAIRVRNGKARVILDRCIDCGECIKACPNGAINPRTDSFTELSRFKYTVALPSPVLYSQYGWRVHPGQILAALKRIGFDDSYDVASACEQVSGATREFLREYDGPRPLISSFCPTIVGLIQVRFPELTDHIIPIEAPREIAAREMKRKKSQELGLSEEDIGAVYITPCPAKMVAIRQPPTKQRSCLDGAISIRDIYSPLLSAVMALGEGEESDPSDACALGIDWTRLGGVSEGMRLEDWIAVTGLSSVIAIFKDIENRSLQEIEFISCFSCLGGCIGGSLTVENHYVARNKVIRLAELGQGNPCPDEDRVRALYRQGYFFLEKAVTPRPVPPLDRDIAKALVKMKKKDRIYRALPRIDCGVCGSPTCMAFAEDVVRGQASLKDCIFNGPGRIQELTAFYGAAARESKATGTDE